MKWTEGEDAKIVDAIIKRAMKINPKLDALSLHMDISAANANGCPLKLQELLDAPDFEFIHDVFNISIHLDRKTGKLLNAFRPHFAKKDNNPCADCPYAKGINCDYPQGPLNCGKGGE